MKTQSAKAKGRRLQQQVRDAILTKFSILEPDDVKSTSMGAGGEDVQLSPAARKLVPFNIECKARAKIAIYEWFEQAKGHGQLSPCLIVKADRKDPLVVISLPHFLELIGDK